MSAINSATSILSDIDNTCSIFATDISKLNSYSGSIDMVDMAKAYRQFEADINHFKNGDYIESNVASSELTSVNKQLSSVTVNIDDNWVSMSTNNEDTDNVWGTVSLLDVCDGFSGTTSLNITGCDGRSSDAHDDGDDAENDNDMYDYFCGDGGDASSFASGSETFNNIIQDAQNAENGNNSTLVTIGFAVYNIAV